MCFAFVLLLPALLNASQNKATARWPLSDSRGSSSRELHATVEKLLADGDDASRETARRLLEEDIAKTPGDPGAIITKGRNPSAKHTEQLHRQIDLSYEYALLYTITGNPGDAKHSARILRLFAGTISHWPLIDRDGKPHAQDDAAYLRHWQARGLWRWHPSDLEASIPMLRAYDLIRSELSAEEDADIRENLFFYHKNLVDCFTGLAPLYHNLAGYHLVSLIRYGLVLDRPDFIHEVVKYWREFVRYSYAPDGFFRELTPDYHQQITLRIFGTIPALLKGYSDPPDYTHPETGTRFDNLDLEAENPALFARVRPALSLLAMPDKSYVNINDSWPKKMTFRETAADTDRPGLLGISGLAKLGRDGMVAFLQFDGIRGHDHNDALGLVWFAAGMEVLSDTGYRPLPGSEATREWIADTAAHNTVAVDEETHFKDRSQFAVPRRVAGFTAFPPDNPGTAPIEAALPAAAGFANQGRLLVWDAAPGGIQAMEAEQERANANTTLFRRTVVMVPLEGDEGFLVDIFRVRGGSTHDYFLRGGLDEAAQITFDTALPAASGTAYKYIQIKKRGRVKLPLAAQITFASGKASVFSRLAAIYGSPGSTTEVVLGEAPAIRCPGFAPFSFIRHQAKSGGELASCFVWVHEASRGVPRIREVITEESNGNVVVRVRSDDREDWIFSGAENDSVIHSGGFEFEGRLASATVSGDHVAARVHGGTRLTRDGDVVAEKPRPLSAEVTATLRKDAGDASDSALFVPPEGASLAGYRLAHFDLGDAIRFSIPVTAVHWQDGKARVDLGHSPGFVVEPDAIVMTNFPGWRIRGKCLIHLE